MKGEGGEMFYSSQEEKGREGKDEMRILMNKEENRRGEQRI
jgi:hypothetical protein